MNRPHAEAESRGGAVVRWLAAGVLFLGVNSLALYVFVGLWGLQVMVATLLSAEICTLMRFLLNEWWVFGSREFGWNRLWQYHAANAAAFVVWWVGANLLTRLGLNYLLASTAAVACSTGFSFVSNFFWVWRKRRPSPGA